MNAKTLKRNGGFIIKKQLLENTLNDPNTVGLAFALNKPGRAKNVKLRILAIYKEGNKLVGKEVEFKGGKGAPSSLQYPSSHVNDFRFRFLRKLEEDKFSFGFYQKERFELLFNGKGELNELFIGGGKVIYNDNDIVGKGEWFTLTISLRKGINSHALKNGLMKKVLNFGNKVSLPKPNKKSIISINTLEERYSSDFNGHRKVESLILDGTNKYVKGIVFSDNTEAPVIFDNDQKVKSVLLSEQQTLRKLIVETEIKSEFTDFEEDNIGLFPNADHTVPCPPHWPEENVERNINAFENTVAEAVFECLKIS